MRLIQPCNLIPVQTTFDWRCGTYRTECEHVPLMIVSSVGYGWEHVSVSAQTRVPNWQEMCFVKDIFWAEDEVVIQIHPAKKDHISFHPFVLHLWKPDYCKLPLPPKWMIGPYKGWEKDIPKELL